MSIYSEAENRPNQKEDDRITAKIFAQAKAKKEARRLAAASTPTPKREVYQNHLRVAIDAVEAAVKVNPNEEHALMNIVCELKTILSGRFPADSQQVRMVAAQLIGVMGEQK